MRSYDSALARRPQIRVKFKTAVARFAVDDVSIAVPARFTRDGLSEVINHLLGLGT